MLRFIHSSDWHLTAGKFFEETLRCLEYIAEVGEREKVDGYLLPGDFTHSDLPHRVQTPTERAALAGVLMTMKNEAVVWMLHGNHDVSGDLQPFGWISGVNVAMAAGIPAGSYTHVRSDAFDVLTVPYPHKRHWLAQRVAGAVESQRQELSCTLRQTLLSLAQQRRPGVPLIGLAHLNIGGSKLGGGEVLIGQEIELSPADLDEIGCDYWALGHIHNPQQMASRAWYAGTPQPHSFGDSNVNGFNLVEIEGAGKPPRVTFVETPAVKLCTVRATWNSGAAEDPATKGWAINWADQDLNASGSKRKLLEGCHLRVVATVDEDERGYAEFDRLERLGSHYKTATVKIERRIIPTTRVRSERIRSAHTPAEKLAAYFETLEPAPPEADRAEALEALDELADAV